LGNERVSNSTSAHSALVFIGVWLSQRVRLERSRIEIIEFCVSSGCSITSVLLLDPVLIYYHLMTLRLVVEHDSETKRWAAFFPELPGCASAGDTEDEAIQNAKEALELWFEPAPVDLPVGAKVLEVALT
jgi:predicted RNase H-like HicB family nuclease